MFIKGIYNLYMSLLGIKFNKLVLFYIWLLYEKIINSICKYKI